MATGFKIKKGDTAPALQAELIDGDGRPMNLTGASIVFRMRLRDGEPATSFEGAGTVDNATRGVVSYQWETGDTDVAGEYFYEWEITFVGGEVMTIPGNKYEKLEITLALND